MKWLLFFGLLAGLDNVQAASAIGLLPAAWRRKLGLALAFAVCETLMLMLGLWLGDRLLGLPQWQMHLELAKALLLFAGGAAVIGLSLAKRDMDCVLGRPAVWLWMPLALSLDNLCAGIGLGALAAPGWAVALAYGGMVLLLCLAGLLLGDRLRRWLQACVPAHADWLSGAYLLLLAGVSLGTL